MKSNTLKEIVDKVYWILGEDETSTIYHKERDVIPAIHSVRDAIISGEVVNVLTGAKIRWGDMGFLHRDCILERSKKEYEVVSVNEDEATATLDDLSLNEEQFPLLIDGMVKIVKVVDGAIQNTTDFQKEQKVRRLFKLPKDCKKPLDLFKPNNEKLIHYRTSEIINEYPCYVIYRDQEWDERYIAIYGYEGKLRLAYQTKLPEMNKSDDVCGLPDNYGINSIAYIVAGEILVDTSEVNKATAILNKGYKSVGLLYSEYASETKKSTRRVKKSIMRTSDFF